MQTTYTSWHCNAYFLPFSFLFGVCTETTRTWKLVRLRAPLWACFASFFSFSSRVCGRFRPCLSNTPGERKVVCVWKCLKARMLRRTTEMKLCCIDKGVALASQTQNVCNGAISGDELSNFESRISNSCLLWFLFQSYTSIKLPIAWLMLFDLCVWVWLADWWLTRKNTWRILSVPCSKERSTTRGAQKRIRGSSSTGSTQILSQADDITRLCACDPDF